MFCNDFAALSHGNTGGISLAAILATNILVSAIMTRRPLPANTMLADTVPKKNFPKRVPSLFQTFIFNDEMLGDLDMRRSHMLRHVPERRLHSRKIRCLWNQLEFRLEFQYRRR